MDLQQRRARNRSDRIHPLGMLEAEPAPLPSRDQQHADLAGRSAATPRFARIGRTDIARRRSSIGQAHRRRRLGPRASAAQSCVCRRLLEQRCDLIEIDRRDLLSQLLAAGVVDFVPKLQQVLLAVAAASRAANSLRFGRRWFAIDSSEYPPSHPGVRQQAQQRKQHEYRGIREDRCPDVSRPACHRNRS